MEYSDDSEDINEVIRKAVGKKTEKSDYTDYITKKAAMKKKKEVIESAEPEAEGEADKDEADKDEAETIKAEQTEEQLQEEKSAAQEETQNTQETEKSDEKENPFKRYLEVINEVKKEVAKIVVGQESIVDGILRALFANGHVLVEGVPGIAKSLIIRAVAATTGCKFGRVQFTVDLLPSDIVGVTALSADKSSFEVLKGPIFNHFLMADEINRAPPKTQSALLEAMAEQQVSISRETYKLDLPFFVMATQNPIESSGTYPLPEAQTDRFLFKLVMDYPDKEEEARIIEQNINLKSFESFEVRKLMNPEDILNIQKVVQKIRHTPRINSYIVEIVNATRHPKNYGISLGKYISLGSSPRASIFLFIAGKADAFLRGQRYITPQNIKNVAKDVLRHRIHMNYRAQIDNVKSDDIVKEILSKVRIP